MAKLKFDIQADLEKVTRLREELVRLQAVLASTDGKGLDSVVSKLNSVQSELDSAIKKTAQHEAAYQTMSKGVTSATGAMVNSLKSNLKSAEQEVDEFTRQILKQKALIKDIEKDVADRKRAVNNAYGMAKSPALGEYNASVKALNEEKAALAGLTTKQGEAKVRVRELKREYQDYNEQLKRGGSATSMFAKGLALVGGVYAFKRLSDEIIGATGQIQMLNVSFATLLQSKEKANLVMQEIIKTAVTTPFQLTELATGAKQLIAYGFAAEEVNGTLIRLGNVASALGLPLERLTYLYGTTRTQGRLYARDMLQFTTSGIPMLQGLADMYGKSTADINKMVSAGKIGFPEVQKVIEQMTSKGGKFYNLMQEQAKTIPGQISNLKDSFTMMFNDIGQGQTGLISGTISLTKAMVDNYEKVGGVIMTLISTYGIYSAGVLIAAAANGTLLQSNNALVVGFVKARTAIMSMNAALMANPYAAIAAGIVLLVGALWTMNDATTAQERAQRSLNETMEQSKQTKESMTNDANSLVSKIRSETASINEQVEAWNELIKKYEFFAKYSIDDLRNMTDKELSKVMSQFTTGISENLIVAAYEEKKREYDALMERFSKETGNTILGTIQMLTLGLDNPTGDMGPTTRQILAQAKVAKLELDELEKKMKSFGKTKQDIDKQANIQKLAPEAREDYYKRELETLRFEQQKLEAINPEYVTDKQKDRLDELKKLIAGTQSELDKFKASNSIKDQAYWEKQKKDAEEALKAIDSASLKILQKTSPKALKSGNVAGVDPMIVEAYNKNKSLMDEATGELERYSFSKNAKAGDKAEKEREEARKRLDKKLKEDRINAELEYQGSILAAQMDSYDKQLNELKIELAKQNAEVEKKRDEALEILAKSKGVEVKDLTKEDRVEVDNVYDEQVVKNKKVYNDKVTAIETKAAKELRKIWREASDSQLSDNEREIKAINEKYDELIKRAREAGATINQINMLNSEREKAKTSAMIEQGLALIDFEESVQNKLAETSKSFFDQQNAIKRKQIQASIDAANERIALLQAEEVMTGKDNSQEIQKWLNVVVFSRTEMERLKDNYFIVAEALGSALAQSSDKFVSKIGAMLQNIGSQLGGIQKASVSGDSFGKVSGIISLAITVGNYIKEIRIWSEGRAIEAQRKVTEQVARRLQYENEINKMVAERQAMESEGLFTGKNYEKVLTDNLALITSQSDKLKNSLGELYSNAIFTSEGSAKRNLFGTKTGDYEFTLTDILAGIAPKFEKDKILDWFGFGLGFSEWSITKTLAEKIKGGDWMGAVGNILDPLHIFGGGDADKKAKINAFENLQKSITEALGAMGKSVEDFTTMSNEDMLTFFSLMEKSGNITDEATKKLLATAKEQLEAAKEAEEKIKEVIKELAGGLGNELRDSLIKNFKEGFGYGEKAADSLRKSMNKILEDMLANRIFQAAFSGLFDNLEKEMKDSFGAGGDMSWIDDFSRFIEQVPEATDMFNKGMEQAQKKGQEYGFNFFNNDTQQETSSGFQAMRQETGEELSGRFSAMQMAALEDNQINKSILAEVRATRETIADLDFEKYHDESLQMMDEIRANSATAIRHLAKIEKHTEVLPQMGADMKQVVENTKYLKG